MQSILPWLAIAILIVAGWMLIKRSQSHMTLLFAGLAMILLALGFGVTNILPKGAKSTGLALFNVFDLLRVISIKQVTGIGFLIMTAGGFAGYMDRIGAANALVKVCTAPLKKLSQPYLVLVLGYIIGQVLVTVIPSAAGLAMLLLTTLKPETYPYLFIGFVMATFLKMPNVLPVAIIGTSLAAIDYMYQKRFDEQKAEAIDDGGDSDGI